MSLTRKTFLKGGLGSKFNNLDLLLGKAPNITAERQKS